MSGNVFGSRLRTTLEGQITGTLLDEALTTVDINDDDDATAQLVIIPVHQEIAADFQLIGYDNTIRRIEEVLTQRGKQRNVMLFGHNGIGKSALIQGLVQRKNRGDLSTHMFKRMFYRLNTSRLLHMDDVAEINKQFDQALEQFSRYDVMVIENFHTLMTALKIKGANAVLVGFLEALSRRRMQSIITCNVRERTLIINEVPEIHEFFAPEQITDPTDIELLNILRGVHRSYEMRYAVTIPDESVRIIRDLTQKYRNGLEGWAQPGRALILLDRSIAQFSVQMNSRSPELVALESELATTEYELQSIAIKDGEPTRNNSDRWQELQSQIDALNMKVRPLRELWTITTAPIQALQTDKMVLDQKLHVLINKRRRLQDLRGDNNALVAQNTDASKVADQLALTNRMIDRVRDGIRDIDDKLAKINLSEMRDHVVTPADISKTFSELSGIPVGQLNANERERMLTMEDTLGKRVFEQPEAIKIVASAVRRDVAKLSADERTPKGCFLFLGPSGVGKTELSKAMAEFITADEKNMIRMDMSEFMEKHSVSRLIGAPPGYAGYEDGGILTNAVLQRPKAVINFDEAEKAHEDIFKILLQVMSDGRLTDGRGETVDFRETYLALTSNIGAHHFLDDSLSFQEAARLARRDVEKFFLPEFLGRLGTDNIVCFRRLSLESLMRVARRRTAALNVSIGVNHLKLLWPDPDIQRFCEKNQDPRYGARPILGNMKTTLEADLAIAILSRTNEVGGTFHATFNDDKLNVTFEPDETPT